MGAKVWSPEEVELLIKLHPTELTVEQIAESFPLRSPMGVQCMLNKLQLGQRPTTRAEWDDEELAALRHIWFERGSLKSLVPKHIPNRGWRSAMDMGRQIGLPRRDARLRTGYSWVSEEMRRVLGELPNLTVPELAERTTGSGSRVRQVLKAGHGSSFYRSGWTRSHAAGEGDWVARWSLGSLPDVPKPEKVVPAARMKRYRKRLKVRSGHYDPFAALAQQVSA